MPNFFNTEKFREFCFSSEMTRRVVYSSFPVFLNIFWAKLTPLISN